MENPDDTQVNKEEPQDLRASLEAAFEQGEEPAAEVKPEGDKPRDEHGKFVAAEKAGEGDAKPDATAPVVTPPEITPPNVPAAPDRRAPSSWKPDAQAAFNALPPNIQDEVLRRETDYHKGIEGYKTHAQTAQAFERAVQPYMQTIQQLGVDAPTAVAQLLKADHTLRYADPATKVQFFSQLAQQYGIDLTQVANPPAVDPQVAHLQQQVQRQQQEMQRLVSDQAQQQQTAVLSQIERFAAEPNHPHFSEVRDEMALLLQSGKAQDLQSAYDTAVWMRGDIRQSLIEQQRAEAQKKATEQAQHQKAKAAAVSVKGSSPATGGVPPVKGSLRETIEAAFADS